MIRRRAESSVREALRRSAAVVLLGPRQVGKTTLALSLADELGGAYLDLESDGDRMRLAEPELYLGDRLGGLVVLDEVHRAPALFPVLRGLIDRARRGTKRTGLYLLLGSASLDLAKQSGESLAGRVELLELAPLDALETRATAIDPTRLWLRGGFPESLLADTDVDSLAWRTSFIRTYLERDVPMFAPRVAAETLRRFWTMLAHHQGGILNVASFARSLGADVRTVSSYLDLLVDLMLVRRLAPWHANVGKRLVKSPKVYVRDSGLVHALLSLGELDALLAHPIVGASWEGHVVENLLSVAPPLVTPYFYRSSGGAEIDLLLVWPGGALWAIEIKRSLDPRPRRGFHAACVDLRPARRFVVYPGTERYRVGADIEAIPLADLADLVVTGV